MTGMRMWQPVRFGRRRMFHVKHGMNKSGQIRLTSVSSSAGWDHGGENGAGGVPSSCHCTLCGTLAKIEAWEMRVDRVLAGCGSDGRLSSGGAACLSPSDLERALPELGSKGRSCRGTPANVSLMIKDVGLNRFAVIV